MILRKIQDAPAPVDSAAVIAALGRRLAELQRRDQEALDEIILLEKTSAASAHGADVGGADAAQARGLLEGKQFVASGNKPPSRLDALYAERRVIAVALKIGSSEKHRLDEQRAVEIWGSYWTEIAKIELRRVRLAIELQRTNQEREILREKIVKAGGVGLLSTDSVDLLGFHSADDEVRWASERVIADDIATRAEIDRMVKSDG